MQSNSPTRAYYYSSSESDEQQMDESSDDELLQMVDELAVSKSIDLQSIEVNTATISKRCDLCHEKIPFVRPSLSATNFQLQTVYFCTQNCMSQHMKIPSHVVRRKRSLGLSKSLMQASSCLKPDEVRVFRREASREMDLGVEIFRAPLRQKSVP